MVTFGDWNKINGQLQLSATNISYILKTMGGIELIVDYDDKEKLLMVKITEEIDHHATEKIRRSVDYEIQRLMPRKVIFDFNSVLFMDSAGIGMIIGRYRTCKTYGGNLELQNVKPKIKKILDMSGVTKVIPVVENYQSGGIQKEQKLFFYQEEMNDEKFI